MSFIHLFEVFFGWRWRFHLKIHVENIMTEQNEAHTGTSRKRRKKI